MPRFYTQHYCPDGHILENDRTVDSDMIQFARRSGRSIYEIKGQGQQTLEITDNIPRMIKLFNSLGGKRVFEIINGRKFDVTLKFKSSLR